MTAEFVAEEGVLKGLVLTLADKDQWIIGRDPDLSDLVIEDPKASRRHLICRQTEDGIVIENLSETNPVRINDRSFTDPTLLQEGDKVTIGGTVFRFYEKRISDQTFSSEPDIYEPLSPFRDFSQEKSLAEDQIKVDLSGTTRFIFKVISGPNTGAEFALEEKKEYLIGTDTTLCDIVFYDLSVSREHAKLSVAADGEIYIEDLGSRNGVLIDRERISGKRMLSANTVVSIGTSSFLIIDKESPSHTIVAPAPILEAPQEIEEEISLEEPEVLQEQPEPVLAPAGVVAEKAVSKPLFSPGHFLIFLILAGLFALFAFGIISLFVSEEAPKVTKNYSKEIQEALKPFPAVKFTFNPSTGRLFLMGHLSTAVEKNELLYNLQGLCFIRGKDDNIVVDEAVWQEMNLLLAAQNEFQGVTMHSPAPGQFVLNGYLKTNKQAAALQDYINLHFTYLDRLESQVVVEEQILDETTARLMQAGFGGVTPSLANGELILTGYIGSNQGNPFQVLVCEFSQIPGIRTIRNLVVALSPERAVIDLNEKYPGRYQVMGYSKHCNININIVINGLILTRGDCIDGMKITSIQLNAVFLEKDGLKYKIEYNKCQLNSGSR